MAPDTPDLDGMPMVHANSPEKSYMPQDRRSWIVDLTVSCLRTTRPVSGHRPPLARDAAITASVRQLAIVAHA